jgi:hypothetical protein
MTVTFAAALICAAAWNTVTQSKLIMIMARIIFVPPRLNEATASDASRRGSSQVEIVGR